MNTFIFQPAASMKKLLLAPFVALLLTGATACAQTLFVGSNSGNAVSSFSIATGAASSGYTNPAVNGPQDLALSGSTLFVANYAAGTVGAYNALTGATINASLVQQGNAFGLAASGNNLYVATQNGAVAEYNATTGARNTAFTPFTPNSVRGLTLSGNTLYVVNVNSNTVGTYNATTGAVINAAFISSGLNGPRNAAVVNGNLFVTNTPAGTVSEYNATTGAVINDSFLSGLNGPFGIAAYGNDLFVSNVGTGVVGEYDATTGAVINSSFETGTSGTNQGLVAGVVPEPSTWTAGALLVGAASVALRRRRRAFAA